MKKSQKILRLAFLLAITAIALPLLSFKPMTMVQQTIVVGIAYEDMSCGSLTVKTAKGYQFESSSSGSLTKMISGVRAGVANRYGVAERDVVIKTGYKSHAVIIQYQKEVSGWNCTKTLYAVGFGNSFSEAEQHASKIRESKKGSYTVLKQITVS